MPVRAQVNKICIIRFPKLKAMRRITLHTQTFSTAYSHDFFSGRFFFCMEDKMEKHNAKTKFSKLVMALLDLHFKDKSHTLIGE